LRPFATEFQQFLYPPQNQSAEGTVLSAQITYTGPPGALRAGGFSTSLVARFFNTVRFVDPKLSTEAALYATGLHLNDSFAHLSLSNVSSTVIAVSGFIYPLGPSATKSIPITAQSFAAGESAELKLPKF